PFRRYWELAWRKPLDRTLLDSAASLIEGDHCFRGFAVKNTAPASDDHHCTVLSAAWNDREGGIMFKITANRFLHHMVRFLVGTMLDIASGRRALDALPRLLEASENSTTSPPAPAHGLFLEKVEYPMELYLVNA
ncbi:MAG TPA: hypothetical protein VHM24_12355, partial [Gemmatimonadaceae bacterium]|nr:hypothetical protein [Gemmatimonadaceae bacterium]